MIKAIISQGEERTQQQVRRSELSNFKSDSFVQQGEGEDFRTGQRKALGLSLLTTSKRERKSDYSVDSYFKDTL
ncbi:hypothetical protein F5887DRAFT_957779 [Amanita rubescens]|nr:hypothetical protein F5887DRAFT_957779 [Amanita rubescens]